MRQGNSNKRMRGRGGNGGGGGGGNMGRKGPNPLSRTYESTGPDVKIRGTALHIADKYVSLARDAQSSGDPVLAESYLQHAEHYYRIIAAAQASMPQPMPVIRSDIQGDDDEDEFDDTGADRFDGRGRAEQRAEPNGNEAPRSEGGRGYEGRSIEIRGGEARGGEGYMPADAPQPFVDDSPNERAAGERDERRPDRGRSRFRTGRGDYRSEGPRSEGPRSEGPRSEGGSREGTREGTREGGRPPRERHSRYEREPREPRFAAETRDEPLEANLDALPAFLTAAPPRISTAAAAAAAAPVAAAAPEPVETADEAEAPRRRTRGGRGRGRRADAAEGAGETPAPASVED